MNNKIQEQMIEIASDIQNLQSLRAIFLNIKYKMKHITDFVNELERNGWPNSKNLFNELIELKNIYDVSFEFLLSDFSKSINKFIDEINKSKIDLKNKKTINKIIENSFSQLCKDVTIEFKDFKIKKEEKK